jgi:hypothetical protein
VAAPGSQRSGREPMTLLRELFTDEGCGTLVVLV